jgi:glycosyltransferase involved in cell wall biosynthesis
MAGKSFEIGDISVVIPTYNRANELRLTLKSLLKFSKQLNEILVVDQSRTDDTKNLVNSLKNKKIKYIFSKTPSITIARNLGVKNASKSSRIICFLDDDVAIFDNYFPEILRVFNEHPEALAAAAKDPTAWAAHGQQNKLMNFIRRIFFLGYYEHNRARIVSAYGNTYPINLQKTITAEWIPGVNMVYKKSIFKELKFDENLLGYAVAEDTGFSYSLHKRHPNTIFVTPHARLIHRVSQVAREPTARLAYINQVDHFYFNFKCLNRNLAQKLIFIWSLFGISLLRTLSLLTFKKSNYLKFKFFFQSLFYCLKNFDKIKQGRVREF